VSPHHFLNALQDIYDVFGNRQIAVTRELTKAFEEVVRGPVSKVIDTFRQRSSIKGELTLVIAGTNTCAKPSLTAEQIVQELKKRIDTQGLSRKDAVKSVAKEYGLAKNMVYQYSVTIKKEDESL
jgi:16S rRNA (cytidine1402-2'-O)-methyltransferase